MSIDEVAFWFAIASFAIVLYGIGKAWILPYVKLPLRSDGEKRAEPVPIPVPSTSTEQAVPLDIYAEDEMIIRALAGLHVSASPQSGYRFTANAIYSFVKGNRSEVLALIKEQRSGIEYVGDMRQRIAEEEGAQL